VVVLEQGQCRDLKEVRGVVVIDRNLSHALLSMKQAYPEVQHYLDEEGGKRTFDD